jgi:hypothetical protein
MEYIPRQVTNSEVADTTIDHTGVASSFIHLATDAPDGNDDEGTGFAAGCLWIDYSNGETYVCVASTDEAAKWAAQDGSDDINILQMQGSTYGWYASGRFDPGSPATPGNHNRYSLASSGNGSDIGEANGLVEKGQNGSIRDTSYGFHVMGYNPGYPDVIDRFPFTAPTGVTDVGEGAPSDGLAQHAGNTSGTYGFVSGGYNGPPSNALLDEIYTFPLANPSNPFSDTGGELTSARTNVFGVSDPINGYGYVASGDEPSARNSDAAERFAFVSTGNASDIGEMNTGTIYMTGHSSPTHGYGCGGSPWPSYPELNTIQKFTLAASTTSADVSEMTEAKGGCRASSGDGFGYIAGGADVGPSACKNTIERNSTTADSAGADVGELTEINMMGCATEN